LDHVIIGKKIKKEEENKFKENFVSFREKGLL